VEIDSSRGAWCFGRRQPEGIRWAGTRLTDAASQPLADFSQKQPDLRRVGQRRPVVRFAIDACQKLKSA